MILDMTSALDGLTRAVVLRTVTTTTVDFVETETPVDVTIQASVTPPSPQTLRAANLDSSVEYKRFISYSLIPIAVNVIDGAKLYRIVQSSDWLSDYGFCDAIGELVQ